MVGELLIEGFKSTFHGLVFNTLCTLSPTLFLSPAIRLCVATIQQHLIPTFLSNSMSCAFIHVASSAWSALLALPTWETPGSDIISLMLFSNSLGWVKLCCLCVFSELVLWALGHSPLFIYVSTSLSGQEWVMYGTSPWHLHPIWGLAQGRHHKYSMSWK